MIIVEQIRRGIRNIGILRRSSCQMRKIERTGIKRHNFLLLLLLLLLWIDVVRFRLIARMKMLTVVAHGKEGGGCVDVCVGRKRPKVQIRLHGGMAAVLGIDDGIIIVNLIGGIVIVIVIVVITHAISEQGLRCRIRTEQQCLFFLLLLLRLVCLLFLTKIMTIFRRIHLRRRWCRTTE